MTETTCTVAHEEPIAETVMETGIRCALARGMWDRESRLAGNYEQITEKSWYRDDPALLADDLAYTEEFFARWFEKGQGRLRPWVHNLGVPSCSDQRYLAGDELARKWGTGVMTHINRDREEIELAVSLFGHRPLEHLAAIGGPDRAAGGHPRHAHHRPGDRPDGRGRGQAGPRPGGGVPTSCRRSPGCR